MSRHFIAASQGGREGGDVKKYNCVHHIGGVASIVEHLYRVHVLAFEVLQIMEGGHKQLLK